MVVVTVRAVSQLHSALRPRRLAAILSCAITAVAAVGVTVAVTTSGAAPPAAAHGEAGHDHATMEQAQPATQAPAATLAPADETLVVKVDMGEFFFSPSQITVPAAKTIRFEVSNPGVVPHELVIGDRHVQDDAEKAMASGGAGHGTHSHGAREAPSVYLGAGESGTLEATFDTPGELLIGCHVPGHWAAGMKGTFTVTG